LSNHYGNDVLENKNAFFKTISLLKVFNMDMLRLQSSSNSSSNDMTDKAKRVWNMLDELATSDPTAYK
jgi:hypothetical protein